MRRHPTLLRRIVFFSALTATVSAWEAESSVLKPTATGPVHEAFLSPRLDVEPPTAPRSPPPPVVERPAADPPNAEAQWIPGYWEWIPESQKFTWVTGTWRTPPPGRFWVNPLWRRDADGWRRTPGFWSDRSTDRIVFRHDAPPARRPPDDPGAPPKPNCFYIPGQYVPEGDGLTWRKGFWADARPGWAWVPAGWARQPEGWTFQEGYWDRPLEDRGTLFAPAEPDAEIDADQTFSYAAYTIVSPELYGQLYGAFGRWSPWYDGYPGVCYDADGRYFAYADYGRLAPFYGYLDYPALGSFGYPYLTSPITYPLGSGSPLAASGSLAYGLGLPYYGFGAAILPLTTGYPLFGNLGLLGGGWGWGWPGWTSNSYAWGIPGWSGVALGTWPGFGWGTWGWSGPALGAWPGFQAVGFPNWYSGWGGWGWGSGGFGWGGWGSPGLIWGGPPIWAGCYPFANSGRRAPTTPAHERPEQGATIDRPVGTVGEHLASRAALRSESIGSRPVAPPPSMRPFASLENRPNLDAMRSGLATATPAAASFRFREVGERSSAWRPAYNGVAPLMRREHQAARPAFTDATAGVVNVPGIGPMVREPSSGEAIGPHNLGRMRQATPGPDLPAPGRLGANSGGAGFFPQLGPRNFPSPRGGETLFNPNEGRPQALDLGAARRPGLTPNASPSDPSSGFPLRMRNPAMETRAIGEGFTGGVRQPRGFAGTGNFGAGVYNGGSMFSGGMRQADAPGFGGVRGGFNAGGPAEGFGGFGGMRGGFEPMSGFRGGLNAPSGGLGSGLNAPSGGGFGGHMR